MKPAELSSKIAPAPRDGDSEVLKDSRLAFRSGNSLCGSRYWASPEGNVTGLSKRNVGCEVI